VEAVGDISHALVEQKTASQDVVRHVERIAQMSEENSAATAKTATTAKEVLTVAMSVEAATGRFSV
jgi:methyl-accepting chemotaxis protein